MSLVTYQAVGLVELGSFTASDNLKAHLFDEFRITTDYFLKVSNKDTFQGKGLFIWMIRFCLGIVQRVA